MSKPEKKLNQKPKGYRRAYPRVTRPFTADACRFCAALTAIGDASHVVVGSDGGITIGGLRPDDEQISELANEARQFKQMRLGQLFTATSRDHAVRIGLKDATSFDHTLIAKAMLYVADLNGSILNAIENEDKMRRATKEAREGKKA